MAWKRCIVALVAVVVHFGSEVVVHVRCLRYLYLDGYEN